MRLAQMITVDRSNDVSINTCFCVTYRAELLSCDGGWEKPKQQPTQGKDGPNKKKMLICQTGTKHCLGTNAQQKVTMFQGRAAPWLLWSIRTPFMPCIWLVFCRLFTFKNTVLHFLVTLLLTGGAKSYELWWYDRTICTVLYGISLCDISIIPFSPNNTST